MQNRKATDGPRPEVREQVRLIERPGRRRQPGPNHPFPDMSPRGKARDKYSENLPSASGTRLCCFEVTGIKKRNASSNLVAQRLALGVAIELSRRWFLHLHISGLAHVQSCRPTVVLRSSATLVYCRCADSDFYRDSKRRPDVQRCFRRRREFVHGRALDTNSQQRCLTTDVCYLNASEGRYFK